jgi:hypothetical protein
MKAVGLWLIIALVLASITFIPTVSAQEDDEDTDDSGCILTSFCIIMFFILFLIYLSSRKKASRDAQTSTQPGTPPRQPGYPPRQTGYRYPVPHRIVAPQTLGVPKGEVKCDLCGSKNLRTFEGGYFKCNDCRHVFYISETGKRRR